MKWKILQWLLGIWLVESITARHILQDEETNGNGRFVRDHSQRQPFHPSHFNYNTYRTPIRRAPPQVPGRQHLIDSNGEHHYSNYFTSNTENHENQQNQNVYSAVRLHGALEARARAEPGSNTLLPTTGYHNYQQVSGQTDGRNWRRETQHEGSLEREEDLARFSLYNSYFDNEHSIKALNSMKCVTPTGSPGFCSTFRGCVPSFFTREGDLEAPALAELISTSIGYCTTNVSHHNLIREQRQFEQQLTREERRYNSVANRIICCPGVAPMRDPNQDPDKIFNDYLESQKNKHKTTTSTEAPAVSENTIDGADNSVNQPADVTGESGANQNPTQDENENHIGEQNPVSDSTPVSNEVQPSENAQAPEGSGSVPEMTFPAENESGVALNPVTSEPANVGESQGQVNPEQSVSSPVQESDVSKPSMEDAPAQGGESPAEGSPDQSSQTVQDGADEASMDGASGPSQVPVGDGQSNEGSTPGSPHPSPGKLPQDTQANSQVIKINPDPVSGVNGKFTLPGGIYIVSSTENSNKPKPVRPSGEQVGVPGETIVDSMPIIIVTHPGDSGSMPTSEDPLGMPHMPSFPSDFPPMGSQEQSPPVDDESSMELQNRPVSQQPTEINEVSSEASASSSPPATESSQPPQNDGQVAEEGATTAYPQYAPGHTDYYEKVPMTTLQPEESVYTTQRIASADESDSPAITTSPPQAVSQDESTSEGAAGGEISSDTSSTAAEGVVSGDTSSTTAGGGVSGDTSSTTAGGEVSGDTSSTTAGSLSDDSESDALTIIPEGVTSSFDRVKTTTTTTTQAPAEVADIMTTVKSPSEQTQGVSSDTTTTAPVSPQEVEISTNETLSSSSATPEAVEVTTLAPESVKVPTTLSPEDSDESEEEEERATTVASQNQGDAESDVQKTTVPSTSSSGDAEGDVNGSQSGVNDVNNGDQNDESAPITTASSVHQEDEYGDADRTTVRVPVVGESGTNVGGAEETSGTNVGEVRPPVDKESVVVVAEPATTVPPNVSEGEDTPPKVNLNPGSEITGSDPDSQNTDGPVPVPVGAQQDEAQQSGNEQLPGNEQISETLQPFPASSPAPTGESQSGSNGESGSEQLFPGSESPEQSGSADSTNDQQQPFPVGESSTISGVEQPFPVGESSTTSGVDQPFPVGESSTTSGVEQPFPVGESSTSSGVDQPFPGNEISTTSESSQAANDGGAAGVPTTSSPVDLPNEPISSGSESTGATEVVPIGVGGDQSVPGGEPISSGNESAGTGEGGSGSFVPNPGSESDGSTSSPSGTPGGDTISSGSESSTPGSESLVSGTESPVSGGEPSNPGSESTSPSTAGGSGSESSNSRPDSTFSPPAIGSGDDAFVPPPGSEQTTDGSSGSQSDSNQDDNQSSPSSPPNQPDANIPVATTDSSAGTESPIPHDPPSADSDTADDELPLTTAAPTAGAGSVDTETSPENVVPSVPSDTDENAPSMQEPSQPADNSVSPDNMQNEESVVPTTQIPQDVSTSTSAPVESSSFNPENEEMSSTAAALEPAIPPQEIAPEYQILKACKFQSFFRSVDEMGFSYRHYPWLATIVGGTRPFSSGTLITDRHILTASHFLSNITVSDVFNMRIHIGYRTSYSGQTEGPYAVRKVRKVIRHKGFSFEKLYNDVAVLVLDRPVRFSEDIYPVCLSSNRNAYNDGNAEAIETGWIEDPRTYTISQHHNYLDPHIQKYFSFGYKNITWRLQEAPQRVRTNAECQQNYGFLDKNGIMVTDSMVCAGSGDTRSCSFRGNSGAPLFIRNDDNRFTEQIGIVSWGIGCGHFPFVFTRVESFLPWLDRVVYNSR